MGVRKNAAGHRPRLRHACARTVRAVPPIFRASRVSVTQGMHGAPAGFASWVDAVMGGPATVLNFCLAPIFQVVLITRKAWEVLGVLARVVLVAHFRFIVQESHGGGGLGGTGRCRASFHQDWR